MTTLPDPVRRCLQRANVLGKRDISSARLSQTGYLRLKEGQRWLPFKADQYFAINPPTFMWRAHVRWRLFLGIDVTDEFVQGRGKLFAKVLSMIPVANATGSEVDQGELLRYLAETVWFPTAWLSDYIHWESMTARSSRATLQMGSLAVSAVFRFSDEGDVERVTAERYREENGKFALRSWSGRLGDYEEVRGMRIPTRVEVAWHLDSGDFPCFRAEIADVRYAT